ncbi:MAG TPA: glycosyltransferase [Nitrososphaeraceae archaeon]|nr:glycosyltransferase [Nitrososphaeraceae archaeon]
MKNLYFTPYGVGLGHASRLINIADKFQDKEIRVKFSSYGEAVEFISRCGYYCSDVPPVEFSWNTQGSFSFKNTISNIPMWFTNFSIQVIREVENMTKFSPHLVVSDSRLSSIISAKLLGIPSIVILNQIKLLLSPRLHSFKIARLFEEINAEFMGIFWSISDEILVPDLPPPYTISENNTWNTGSVTKKIKYIGFISPPYRISENQIKKALKLLNFSKSKPIIFFHISGPPKTRIPIVTKILKMKESFGSNLQFIISGGKPNGETIPRKISENGWYYEWCPIRDELFAISDILVIRGGHTAISQAIQFGKPIISIPIENHAEQINNSVKISRIGLGTTLDNNEITPKKIVESIYEILDNSNYLMKSNEIMNISKKLNGVENVVDIVRSYIR